jgi:hypothetical protein
VGHAGYVIEEASMHIEDPFFGNYDEVMELQPGFNGGYR